MYPLSALLLALAAGGLVVGAIVWLVMTLDRQAGEIADLRRRQQDGPAWSQEMKLNHRQQLVSIAALNQQATRDLLDALMRVSPEMAREVIQEVAPHLFQKDGIK